MDSLKLSQLIGDEIIDIRCHYIPENEYGLQEFYAYLKLASDRIIGFPKSGDDDYIELTQENLSWFAKRYDSGEAANDTFKSRIINQKIVDFWFRYYDGALDYGHAYIQLTNGFT